MNQIATNCLSDADFHHTFTPPMRDVTCAEANAIDMGPYVASIPDADLKGHARCESMIEHVYRDGTDSYDHVLLKTGTANVYLAIVVDLQNGRVHGHHLLNLNQKYGLDDAE